MSASGGFGPARACAAIVGNVNLMLGSRAKPIPGAYRFQRRSISRNSFFDGVGHR